MLILAQAIRFPYGLMRPLTPLTVTSHLFVFILRFRFSRIVLPNRFGRVGVTAPRHNVASTRAEGGLRRLYSDMDKMDHVDILFCDPDGTSGAMVADSET